MNRDYIALKWGTLKGWELFSDKAAEALKAFFNEGTHYESTMLQQDSDTQKQKLLELIDAVEESGGIIYLSWDGVEVSAEEAKKYVLEYNNE